MASARLMICPFCGHTQRPGERCQDCGADFAPAARRGLLEAMGPWFLRDAERPFQPGLSYEAIAELAQRGELRKYTILRGPTTRQLWTVARHVPGVAHLLGYCHACDGPVTPTDLGCRHCGATFSVGDDRNALGLPEASAPERTESRSAGFTPAPTNGSAARFDRAEIAQLARGASATAGDSRRVDRGPVSAFATDEELFGSPGAAAAARSIVTRPVAEPAVATAPSPMPTPSFGSPGSIGHEAVERSLRGAVKRQRHVITVLGVLFVAALLAALWPILARTLGAAGEADAARRGDASAKDTASGTAQRNAPEDVHRPGGTTIIPGAPAAEGAKHSTTNSSGDPASAGLTTMVRELGAEIETLGADGSSSIDSRRERAASIEQRLDRAAGQAGVDPTAIASLRERLTAIKARIELDAVLPGG